MNEGTRVFRAISGIIKGFQSGGTCPEVEGGIPRDGTDRGGQTQLCGDIP